MKKVIFAALMMVSFGSFSFAQTAQSSDTKKAPAKKTAAKAKQDPAKSKEAPAEKGEIAWVSDARIESYHTVRFELHEDLLRLMRRERGE